LASFFFARAAFWVVTTINRLTDSIFQSRMMLLGGQEIRARPRTVSDHQKQ